MPGIALPPHFPFMLNDTLSLLCKILIFIIVSIYMIVIINIIVELIDNSLHFEYTTRR